MSRAGVRPAYAQALGLPEAPAGLYLTMYSANGCVLRYEDPAADATPQQRARCFLHALWQFCEEFEQAASVSLQDEAAALVREEAAS